MSRVSMMAGCAALVLSLSAAAQAGATTITFDEFAADNDSGAMPSNRYAGVGVTFTAVDEGATWGGNSGGNPGNWGIEGTNGAQFSGFNGASYAATIDFAVAVNGFSLDASRSNGSAAGDTLTVSAYHLGGLVGTQVIAFGDLNTWSTAAFAVLIDQITFQGAGQGFHPFGIDNLVFGVGGGVPEPATWALMIGGFGLAGAALRRRRALAA